MTRKKPDDLIDKVIDDLRDPEKADVFLRRVMDDPRVTVRLRTKKNPPAPADPEAQ